MTEFLTERQKENLEYFKENLDTYLADKLLKAKFIVIHDKKKYGVFDSFEKAITEAVASLPRDEFIIQQVISESDTVNFLFPVASSL